MTAGSMNTWTAALSRNFVLSDGLSINLAFDRFSSNGYNSTLPALRGAFWPGRANSSATSENLRLTAFLNPAADLKGFVRIGYHEQNEDIGGYRFGTNLQKSPDVQASFTKLIDHSRRVTANAYAQFVDFDKFNGAGCYAGTPFACGAPVPGSGATPGQQAAPVVQYASSHDVNTYRERGGSVVYSQVLQGFVTDLQVGADYRAISGEDAQETYRAPTAALPDALRLQRTNVGRGGQQFAGLFTQVKTHPLDPLEVTLSARLDAFSSTNGAALQTNYPDVAAPLASATSGGAVPGSRKTAFDPSLTARYAVNDRLDLRGAVYKAFRAPGLNNLYRSFGSNSITIANPLLNPETLVGKEIGLDWRGDAYSFGATLFQATVKDVVATYSISTATPIPTAVQSLCGPGYVGTPNAACPGSVSFYTNGQDQRSTGIELDGKVALDRDLHLNGYLTRTRTVYSRATTGDPTGRQLPLVPTYVAGGDLAWQASERWLHDVEVRYSSRVLLSSLTTPSPVVQGAYATVNLSTTFRLNRSVDLSASVVNLFDGQYAADASANNPQSVAYALPRAITVGLRARF